MRVIAGSAKGKPLKTLDGGDTVRPTTDRVKEALFSAIHFDLPEALVLDMFAGSGQLGIEALSRGAKSVDFIDISKESCDVISKNLSYCGFEGKIHKTDYKTFLEGFQKSFDVVFIDPPYHLNIFNQAIKDVSPFLSGGGVIVCEHPKDSKIDNVKGFARRDYKYGQIALTLFRKEAE